MTRITPIPSPQVRTHGPVGRSARAYASTKVETALRHSPAPVLRARLVLDAAAPGHRVEAHADISGVPVHVHAVGSTIEEATDLVQQKLLSCMRRIRRRPHQGPPPPAPSGGELADPGQ